ncbi:PLP-dependent aminotransferase family protein [Endozoicomonas sp. GU-1]|uniref:aminotransferase-like domain-containing protein n=1 Tax=Endozoicomonas sp. GU-1 TaxID=3009078 RepID=UPI0022B46319|nr:PLP-dependent aminotransferase family protein [Endozoicomonas sp. GU-1]WBA82710.1 PLP-dependent aminotransferase family protein [Endozoicomonas sp. GU-1]WBA85641.1 PLP-dependent aminotransferase family protein [Endozoicomonas sp. GU-1]
MDKKISFPGWLKSLSFNSGPKYMALADAIEQAVKNGSLHSGDKLPTHRWLADVLNVTIGTITRGYAEAERRRLITARVGSGTFVTGKVWQQAQFNVPQKPESTVIDMSLTLQVPAPREEILAETLQMIASDPLRMTSLLDYLPETGLERHRSIIAGWLATLSIHVNPDNILITNGGQHGNMMALQAATRPGDTIVSESLTYPGFINAARQWQTHHIGLPMDEHGLIPEALEQCCLQHRPKLLYLMPSLQNPTAFIMPIQRREQIIEIARRHKLLILEDDVQFVASDKRLTSLYSLAPDLVIYSGSFSKTLSGGLRTGYLCYPAHLRERLVMAMRSDCWVPPPLMAEVASEWIESGIAEQLIHWQTEAIARRQKLMTHHLKGMDIQAQTYSFHGWLKLPEPWRAETFVRHLNNKGVKVLQSELFAVGSYPVPQAVRLCISSPDSDNKVQFALATIRDILTVELDPIYRPLVF